MTLSTESTVFDVRNLFNIPYRDDYSPDFDNSLTVKRLKKALQYIYHVFGPSEVSKMVTKDKFFNVLGNTSRGLGAYLKNILFICTDEYYSKDSHIAKKYKINWSGFDYLAAQVFPNDSIYVRRQKIFASAVDLTSEIYKKELEDLLDGNVTYRFVSERFYTKLQNIPKATKQQTLADHTFQYQYDVNCSAATVLYYHAKKLGFDGKLDTILDYINNKTTVRNELVEKTGLSLSLVKMLITGFFSGARLARNDYSSLFQAIIAEKGDFEARRITQLINTDEYIIGLKKNISDMWKFLKLDDDTLSKRVELKIGKGESSRLSAKDKWCLYFKLEQRVLLCVVAYLYERDILSLLEHDGWSIDKKIDIADLKEYIHEKTDFDINISYDFIPSLKTGIIDDKDLSTDHPIIRKATSDLFDQLFNGYKSTNKDIIKSILNDIKTDTTLEYDDMDYDDNDFQFVDNLFKPKLIKETEVKNTDSIDVITMLDNDSIETEVINTDSIDEISNLNNDSNLESNSEITALFRIHPVYHNALHLISTSTYSAYTTLHSNQYCSNKYDILDYTDRICGPPLTK